MLRLYRLLLIVCCAITTSQAQYFQYSQYNFTNQRYNPAIIGLNRYATAGTIYRHQQTGGDFSINSNFLSLSYPFLKSSTGQPWSGIAVSLHNDQSAAVFKIQEASLGYAVHVRIDKYTTLSFGMKALYQSRQIGLQGFYTGSQYISGRGFDQSQSTNENFSQLRSSYMSYSAGTYLRKVDKKGRVIKDIGISLLDFNRPIDTFFQGADKIPLTATMNFSVQSLTNNDFHVFLEGLLSTSGNINTSMFNGGFRFQKELNIKAKKPSDLVDVLLKYAVGRSGIAGIQFHRENFSVGLSYDFPLIVKNPSNTGALEVGVEFRRLVSTRAQKAAAKRKKSDAEKQALAKKTQPKKQPQPKVKKPDSVVVAAKKVVEKDSIAAVTIVENKASQKPSATAKAGGMKQDPMIIEKVTLHFAFEFNSSDLDDPTEQFLDELAETLRQDESLQVNVEGHTDNIGSDKFNLKLSQKRAEVVRNLLIQKGIAAERLHAEGKGMHEPLNQNQTDEDRAKNRRVEITVYY
jgi:type IX secretion system PorP/SprF family membrane protein